MQRYNIITTIGSEYLDSNIENDEFSYHKAFRDLGKAFIGIKGRNGKTFEKLDIRFVDNNRKVAILVETKSNFDRASNPEEQLSAYVKYEKLLTGYSVIAILANTDDDRIMVWRDSLSENNYLENKFVLQTFEEYANIVRPLKVNNKEQVMRNTYQLNTMLHTASINEKLRSQFVGTCVLALKHNLKYEGLSTAQIIMGIREILTKLLDRNLNRVEKLAILDTKVLNDQDIRTLDSAELVDILTFIKDNILNYINDKTTM